MGGGLKMLSLLLDWLDHFAGDSTKVEINTSCMYV
jgi:hypothetical protein